MKQPQNEFDFDVFISYSSKDKQWVRGELLKRIERSSLRTRFHHGHEWLAHGS